MAGQAKQRKARGQEAPQGPAVPDGFDLRKDGTVLVHVDGELYTWRRPKIGEMRKLREAVASRDERLAEAQSAVRKSVEDDDGAADTLQKMGTRAVDLAALQSDLNVEWLAAAWRMLGDREPPPVDDWPSGADQTGMVTGLLQHWRAVPLRSGA